MKKKMWFLIESEEEYQDALQRYEEIKYSEKGAKEYKELQLLVKLISDYEEKTSILPEVDPIELIKIRMEEFGYNPKELASAYGDKGTVSKVLNYKQALSLNMIRKFSDLLKIPADLLIKEYPLHIS
ncbi:XRE family transcriptional regulator [Sphingobacterium sp. SGG-5]|uniref:helix-turn-helix domain-containing protein n=1 Tax=Sphingobacterium sp. SGG-5 TaxID=2710881 RepID=UPI0013EA131B|nr:XRE family transcriptional regulator [Sphingobacterium sp. SGG-5]NGM61414.1 XRE family transcriptional regulator [Sphingobacterium sp. SGG-5]